MKKLQLGCQQRLTNAEAERWATSPFISLIHFKDENRMRFLVRFTKLLQQKTFGNFVKLGMVTRNHRLVVVTGHAH